MSATASLRYQPKPDRQCPVAQSRSVTLAQRHRRYGSGMIYTENLRQAGALDQSQTRGPQVRSPTHCKSLQKSSADGARRCLFRIVNRWSAPRAANEVWSMDFVFDRIASGRSLKILGPS